MEMKHKLSANAKAVAGSSKFVSGLIIALVVLYSDVMFVALLWNAFPGGFMRLLAVGGAFATGVSIIALVVGKNSWFRPGPQLVFSWWFTGTEVVVSMLNIIVSVIVARNTDLGYLSYWVLVAPATPFLSVIGWIVIKYLDKEREALHERMEMEDEQRAAELEHERAIHTAKMKLATKSLQYVETFLEQEIQAIEIQTTLKHQAHTLAANAAQEVTGQTILIPPQGTPSLPTAPAPATVDLAQIIAMVQNGSGNGSATKNGHKSGNGA